MDTHRVIAPRWQRAVATVGLLSILAGTSLMAIPAGASPARHATIHVYAPGPKLTLKHHTTCDVTYSGPASGNWGTAANWSTAAVPTAGQNVCIDGSVAGGNDPGPVIMNVSPTVTSVSVTGGATLEAMNGQTLDATTSMGIDATSTLTFDTSGSITIQVDGTLTNNGTISTVANATVTFRCENLINNNTGATAGFQVGANTVGMQDNTNGGGHALYTNNGTWKIASGGIFNIGGSVGFTQAGGTLTNQGTVNTSGGWTFTASGGTITAPGGANNAFHLGSGGGSIVFSVGSTATGEIQDDSGSPISGNIPAGLTFDLINNPIALTASFTNNGTIDMEATGCCGGTTSLNGTSAVVITNNGTIIVNAATGALQNIQPTLDNKGTLNAIGSVQLGSNGSTTTNEGTFTIGAAATITQANGSSFVQQSGTIANSGVCCDAPGGINMAYTFTGGTATGNVLQTSHASDQTSGNTITFPGGSTFSGTVLTDGATLSGTIPSTTTLDLNDGSGHTIAVATGTVNNGTIVMNNGTLTGAGTFANAGSFATSGAVHANTVSITSFTNNASGSVSVGNTDTLRFNTAPTNYSAGTLTSGTWTCVGNGNMTFPSAITTDAATINLNASGAAISINGSGSDNAITTLTNVASSGTLTLAGAATLTTGGALADAGTVNLGGTSHLTVTGTYSQSAGTTNIQASGAGLTATSTSITGGTFEGIGSVSGNVTNTSGTVEPDSAGTTGTMSITGTYTQAAGGTLAVQVNGTTSSTQYDVLAATSTATINGTVSITTGGGFNPTGHTFTVVTGSSLSGTFSGVVSLTGGDSYSASYTATSAVLNGTGGGGGGGGGGTVTSPPFVASISPSSGPATGGTLVSIAGANFNGATSVMFGSTPATNFTVNSTNSIGAVAPAGSGQVSVSVSTAAGTSSGPSKFSYGPVVTKVSPTTGATTGGTTVTITGAGFSGATAVTFGSAATFTVVSDTQITATTAAGNGTVDVVVTTPLGTSATSTADQFVYVPLLFASTPSFGNGHGVSGAVWPSLLPLPGAGDDAGTTLPYSYAGIYFQILYTQGEHVLIASDPSATKPICVQGNWQFDIASSSTTKAQGGSSSTGTDCTNAPFDIASLNLPTGLYGGQLVLSSPSSGTSYGGSDVYLAVAAGNPGAFGFGDLPSLQTVPPMVMGGTVSIPVGQSGTLPVTVASTTLLGTGVHNQYAYDPKGISVTAVKYATGWTGAGGNLAGSGQGGYIENGSPPLGVGSVVSTMTISCRSSGTWPITFAGNFWSESGVRDASLYSFFVSGSPAVTCTAPPPPPVTTAGILVDHTDSSLWINVTGSHLTGASSATLVNSSGSVVSSAVLSSQTDSSLTAHFPPAPAGPYGLVVTNGAGTQIAGTAYPGVAIPLALPLVGIPTAVDSTGQIPGYPIPHIWSVANDGNVDAVALTTFVFPFAKSNEPFLDLSAMPAGSRLLGHDLDTNIGWEEDVAIPVPAGSSADIVFTATVSPYDPGLTSCSVGTLAQNKVCTFDVVPMTMGSIDAFQWNAIAFSDPEATDVSLVEHSNDALLFQFSTFNTLTRADISSYDETLRTLDPTYYNTFVIPGYQFSLSGEAFLLASPIYQKTLNAGSKSITGDPSPKDVGPGQVYSVLNWLTQQGKLGSYNSNLILQFLWFIYCGKYDQAAHLIKDKIIEEIKNKIPGYAAAAELMALFEGPPALLAAAESAADGAGQYFQWLLAEDANGEFQAFRQKYIDNNMGDPEADWPRYLKYMHDNLDANGGGQLEQNLRQQLQIPLSVQPFPQDKLDFALTTMELMHQARQATPDSNFTNWITSDLVENTMGIHPDSTFTVYPARYLNAFKPDACSDKNPFVNALDPNSISVTPSGATSNGYIPAGQTLNYTIHFQNVPTATASAIDIRVVAQLDTGLNPTTIQQGPSSFAGAQMTYDPATRTITWLLPKINLPPDTSPPNGEGFVSFSVDPTASDPAGTSISELGNVYFNFNPPVTTNTSTVILDSTPPIVATNVSPTPTASFPGLSTESPGTVTVNATGTSPAGVVGYTFFESVDGGALAQFETTSSGSVQVPVSAGHSYGFTAQATDNAGLQSPMPSAPQVSFSVPRASSGASAIQLPPSVALTSPAIGKASGPQSVTVQNLGTTSIQMQSAAISGTNAQDFVLSADTCSGTSLVPGLSCTVGVTFTASQTSIEGASLVFADNGPSSPQSVVLVGTVGSAPSSTGGSGYRIVAADGGVFSFGSAQTLGSLPGRGASGVNVVGSAATPDGGGYWMVDASGNVSAFGDAGFFGAQATSTLNKPIVGMSATSDGKGYWLVASDGGIFSYGDATFYGSSGNIALNKPIVGMSATSDGKGYWLVASDGGIFSYGDATFYGSSGNIALNKPIVGMSATSDGKGYWLVASDGGIFSYGDATFLGSLGGIALSRPAISIADVAVGVTAHSPAPHAPKNSGKRSPGH